MSSDFTLDVLLDMDGYTYYYPSGHWIKIAAKQITKSRSYPCGIKYSLTLHAQDNQRILGYDNSHAVPGDKCDSPYDHKHICGKISRYYYKSASQLLIDFYVEIEKVLEYETEYET